MNHFCSNRKRPFSTRNFINFRPKNHILRPFIRQKNIPKSFVIVQLHIINYVSTYVIIYVWCVLNCKNCNLNLWYFELKHFGLSWLSEQVKVLNEYSDLWSNCDVIVSFLYFRKKPTYLATYTPWQKVLEHHQIYTFYLWHLLSKLLFGTKHCDWFMQITKICHIGISFGNIFWIFGEFFSGPYVINELITYLTPAINKSIGNIWNLIAYFDSTYIYELP